MRQINFSMLWKVVYGLISNYSFNEGLDLRTTWMREQSMYSKRGGNLNTYLKVMEQGRITIICCLKI